MVSIDFPLAVKLLLLLPVCIISSSAKAQTSGVLKQKVLEFQSTLTSTQTDSITFEFGDSSRTDWTNLPVGLAPRKGLPYGSLSEESRIRFHEVLTVIFSSQGYLKVNNIMHLDDYLLAIYETAHLRGNLDMATLETIRKLNWGHGNYFASIWGQPSTDDTWAFKFEGHHISINVTVVEDRIFVSPFFLGSDPSLVRVNQFAGMRPLSKEEDYALELYNMLSEAQQATAVISDEFPMDIITAPGRPQMLNEFQGLKGSEMTADQQRQFEFLIMEYLMNFEREKGGYYLEKLIEKGVDDIYFGWIGGDSRGTNHYYIIHGTDFLIEYDNAGWIHKGDHIHTIFRDKSDDFGEDMLREHYLRHAH